MAIRELTDVFERPTTARSEVLPLSIYLDTTAFVLVSVFTHPGTYNYIDDLPKNLAKTTAQQCKRSTSRTCVAQKRLQLNSLIVPIETRKIKRNF